MAKRRGRLRVGAWLARLGDRIPGIRYIRSRRTKESNVLRGLGVVLFWVSLVTLLPLLYSINKGEEFIPYLVTTVVTFMVSLFLVSTYGASKTYHHTDGLVMVLLLWASLFIIGMIPYMLMDWCTTSTFHCSPINALFESVSGFTTVGATIFENPTELPHSLLFWRVLTQWIGGIIIVLLFMVILPMFVPGRRSLAKNDLQPLTDADGVQMKVIDVAKQFILVYVALTLIFSLVLCATGLALEDAVNIALATISIGGFSFNVDSLASYSDLVKISVAVMMIISATNFYLHFRIITKRHLSVYTEDHEFKAMLVWYAILAVAIFIVIGGKFVDGFFMVVSMATTTGFVSDPNFQGWGSLALLLISIAMFVGGSSGSPAGGIKISRFIILIKSIMISAYEVVNSNVVQVPKINGRPVDEKKVHNAYAVFILFILVIVLSTAVFAISGIDGMTLEHSLFTSISLVTATGTAIGPLAVSYDCLPDLTKIYTCFVMLFARMEIISLLAIFSPKFWVEVGRNSKETYINNNGMVSFLDKIKIYSKK